jgi:hypothetical protein
MNELVVLRVVRPYATESEFLQAEDWTITKKSVFLIGARNHPEGTIVRCELALANGKQLLVAEGIVARHVAQTAERPDGLVVRFRRMTPASTQFVNRALNNRDAADGSSPSAAHNPIPAPASAAASVSADTRKRTDVNREAVSHSTADALKRLSGRTPRPVSAPADRESALVRLRIRV